MRGQLLLEHVSGQLQRGRPEERRGVPAFRAWRGLPQLGGQQTAGAEDLDQGRTGPARDVARLRPGFARVSRVGDTVSDWTAALCILCSLVPIPIIGEPKDGGWRNRARPEQRRW